jgi:ribosomal protein S18 acetylase RimI-like enzyme
MAQLEQILIRKAVSSDLPKMLQIMDETLGSPTDGDDEMEERLERWLIKFNNISQFIFYVAEVDRDNLVGWCRGGRTVEAHKIVAHQTFDCEIQNIFIRPQYQHYGIGRKLWKSIWNDVLLSFQPTNLVVWSVDKEQAQGFYLSLGGVPQDKREFDENCILTAFVWNDLKLYAS